MKMLLLKLKTEYRAFMICFILLAVLPTVLSAARIKAYAAENSDPVVICIDPGHGGENLGAEYDDYTEKEMTLIVADAMREELEAYDGIEVFMTRESDQDLDLQERVDYAESVGADFFFCLHFNMSENHEAYGCENWISAFGNQYARGMDFARIEMGLLTDTGLTDRGIKTRLNSKGTNYYGVLRIADQYDMPGVIIEHCYLDNENDHDNYDHHDKLVEYGKLDATAVAMYYGLKSDSLGKDYTDYSYTPTQVPDSVVKPDDSEPEYCSVSVGEVEEEAYTDAESGEEKYRARLPLTISSAESDSMLTYYSYSLDGGESWSARYPWKGDENDNDNNNIEVLIDLPYGEEIELMVRAYNNFDLYTESDPEDLGVIECSLESEENSNDEADSLSDADYTEIVLDTGDNENADASGRSEQDKRQTIIVFVIAGILALAAIVIVAISIINLSGGRGKRKRRGRDHKNSRYS